MSVVAVFLCLSLAANAVPKAGEDRGGRVAVGTGDNVCRYYVGSRIPVVYESRFPGGSRWICVQGTKAQQEEEDRRQCDPACEAGKRCVSGTCVADPCNGACSGETPECRTACKCTPTSCKAGRKCVDGVCVGEACKGTCAGETPECRVDGSKCTPTSCGEGKSCVDGTCVAGADAYEKKCAGETPVRKQATCQCTTDSCTEGKNCVDGTCVAVSGGDRSDREGHKLLTFLLSRKPPSRLTVTLTSARGESRELVWDPLVDEKLVRQTIVGPGLWLIGVSSIPSRAQTGWA